MKELVEPRTVRADYTAERLPGEDAIVLKRVGTVVSRQSPRDDLLIKAFERLRRGRLKDLQLFIEVYGPLELCRPHYAPMLHALAPEGAYDPGNPPRRECRVPAHKHPLSVYRWYAKAVHATRCLALAVHDKRIRTKKRDAVRGWRETIERFLGGPRTGGRRDTAYDRALITASVTWWLDLGEVRPSFTWSRQHPPALRFAAHWLWGAIGYRLARAVSRHPRQAICRKCGDLQVWGPL